MSYSLSPNYTPPNARGLRLGVGTADYNYPNLGPVRDLATGGPYVSTPAPVGTRLRISGARVRSLTVALSYVRFRIFRPSAPALTLGQITVDMTGVPSGEWVEVPDLTCDPVPALPGQPDVAAPVTLAIHGYEPGPDPGGSTQYEWDGLLIEDADLLDRPLDEVIRLEVEDTTAQFTNKLTNPSGVLGGSGWLTPTSGTVIGERWYPTSRPQLSYRPGAPVGGFNGFRSEPFPVTGGHLIQARWQLVMTPAYHYRMRYEYLNAADTQIGASSWYAYSYAYAGTWAYPPADVSPNVAPLIPAAAVKARIVFEPGQAASQAGTPTWPFPGPTSVPLALRDITVVTYPAVMGAQPPDPMPYYDPHEWINVLGPTHQIRVHREDLAPGTLTATILAAALDPAVAPTIRPGRWCRLTAWNAEAQEFQPLFVGKTTAAEVTYDTQALNLRPGEPEHARITLTAIDAIRQLAAEARPDGVAAISDLPYILEGAGVPWNVNGNSGHLPGTTPTVSYNENASALDQVAVTRDSQLGYAWVDRWGTLQAWDNLPGTTTTDVADEDAYSDLDISFDTHACINEVKVRFLRYADEQTTEVEYGPYRDQASIDEWDLHSKQFTIHAVTEIESQIEAYANEILTRNATPQVRVNSLVMPIGDTVALATAHRDLFDLVAVRFDAKGIDHQSRITSITHTITARAPRDPGAGWTTSWAFATNGTVAAPQTTPAVRNRPLPTRVPFSRRWRTTALTVANASWTALAYTGSNAANEGGGMAHSIDTWTVPKAGLYTITGTSKFVAGTVGFRIHRLMINGAAVDHDYGLPNSSGALVLRVGLTMPLNAGDTIRHEIYQNNGGPLALDVGAQFNVATITYLSP